MGAALKSSRASSLLQGLLRFRDVGVLVELVQRLSVCRSELARELFAPTGVIAL